MIKFALEKWDKNNKKLREVIANTPVEERKKWDYDNLMYLVSKLIFEFDTLDLHDITYDGGENYNGTLMFLIPMNCVPEAPHDWLMSYIDYGSCTVCDTLQRIQYTSESDPDIDAIDEYMHLCRDMVSNTIRPYNSGWMHDDLYDTVTVDNAEE